MNILESLAAFETCEPNICVWCRDCGVVLCNGLWGYVCLRLGNHRDLTKRMKNVITPFPVNTESTRTGIQCVNADERHDCFRPTKLTDGRMKVLDALGILPDMSEQTIAATAGEESEIHICKRCGVAYELNIIDKGFGKPRFCPNCGYKEIYQ